MPEVAIRSEALAAGTYRRNRVLSGFMDAAAFQQLTLGTMSLMNDAERAALQAAYAGTQAARQALPTEDFAAQNALPIPSEHTPYLDRVRETEAFRQVYGNRPYTFSMIDARRLCAFQPYVAIPDPTPPGAGLEQLLRYCIQESFPASVDYTFNVTPTGFRLLATSQSPNFALETFNVGGPGASIRFGPNKNWVQVAAFQGRHYLKNGYHRVFALLSAGVTEVPAVVFETQDWNETGGTQTGFFGQAYLQGLQRPPLLMDFLNEEVTLTLPLRRMMKAIDVNISVNQFGVPL